MVLTVGIKLKKGHDNIVKDYKTHHTGHRCAQDRREEISIFSIKISPLRS